MRHRFVLIMAMVLAGMLPAQAQRNALPPPSNGNEISPPFSLMWHEPSERLEGKITAAKLNILERRKIGDRWAMTVTGFKKPNPADPKAPKPPELRRVLFYFLGGQLMRDKKDGKFTERLAEGQLVEVELQYAQDGWGEDKYGECLGEKRRILEGMYGQGQQLVRTTSPTPDGAASQTIVGYKWNKNNTAVELIYFNVAEKSGAQQFHTLSLHYKRN